MKKEYEVGYGKPPVATRFKPGQNHNPKGRGAALPWSASKIMEGVVNAPVTVNESGKKKVVTLAEYMFRQWTKQAVKGNLKSAELLLDAHGQSKKFGDFRHRAVRVEEWQVPGAHKIHSGMTVKQAAEAYAMTMKELDEEFQY
jgi:hypothetical protein